MTSGTKTKQGLIFYYQYLLFLQYSISNVPSLLAITHGSHCPCENWQLISLSSGIDRDERVTFSLRAFSLQHIYPSRYARLRLQYPRLSEKDVC